MAASQTLTHGPPTEATRRPSWLKAMLAMPYQVVPTGRILHQFEAAEIHGTISRTGQGPQQATFAPVLYVITVAKTFVLRTRADLFESQENTATLTGPGRLERPFHGVRESRARTCSERAQDHSDIGQGLGQRGPRTSRGHGGRGEGPARSDQVFAGCDHAALRPSGDPLLVAPQPESAVQVAAVRPPGLAEGERNDALAAHVQAASARSLRGARGRPREPRLVSRHAHSRRRGHRDLLSALSRS